MKVKQNSSVLIHEQIVYLDRLVGLYIISAGDGMAAYSLISFPCFALVSSTGSSPSQGDGPQCRRADLRGRSFEKSRNIHEQ